MPKSLIDTLLDIAESHPQAIITEEDARDWTIDDLIDDINGGLSDDSAPSRRTFLMCLDTLGETDDDTTFAADTQPDGRITIYPMCWDGTHHPDRVPWFTVYPDGKP